MSLIEENLGLKKTCICRIWALFQEADVWSYLDDFAQYPCASPVSYKFGLYTNLQHQIHLGGNIMPSGLCFLSKCYINTSGELQNLVTECIRKMYFICFPYNIHSHSNQSRITVVFMIMFRCSQHMVKMKGKMEDHLVWSWLVKKNSIVPLSTRHDVFTSQTFK